MAGRPQQGVMCGRQMQGPSPGQVNPGQVNPGQVNPGREMLGRSLPTSRLVRLGLLNLCEHCQMDFGKGDIGSAILDKRKGDLRSAFRGLRTAENNNLLLVAGPLIGRRMHGPDCCK